MEPRQPALERAVRLADLPTSRVLLFGCGFAFLVVGLASAVFLLKADDLLARALDRMQARVEARLADDVPAYERTRLAWAFADARRAVAGGRARAEPLADAQRLLAEYAARPGDRPLGVEEVAALTAALDRVAGREPPATSPSNRREDRE